MKFSRYCRSLLSTPGTAVQRYAKCHHAGADIAMVDLEDSVPPHRKEEARRMAEEFFTGPGGPARRAIRINAVSEPEGLSDLLALRHYPVKPALVLIPKTESARDIEIVEHVLAPTCPDTEFFAVIETPRGLLNTAAIAAASPRLRAVVFGSADYAFAVGARLTWETLTYARATVVNGARAAGIEAMDAPYFRAHDIEGLRYEAVAARDLGFSGKVTVHPRQIPVVNEAFSPGPGLLEHARRVVAAGRENDRDVTMVDGSMIGAPFFEASQQLIEEFG